MARSQENKPVTPCSYQEQLDLLISRGLTVREPEHALERLRQVNYARLKGYLLPFKTEGDRYQSGTEFERVYRLYVFDARLRSLLFPVVSEVELGLRSSLSYFFSMKYGAFGYLDARNFEDDYQHERFLRTLNAAIRDEDNASFLEGHTATDGRYPVWVALELLSMGGLSYFYANMKPQDRRDFANERYGLRADLLENWLFRFTLLRNAVAHYCRLYYAPFADKPMTPDGSDRTFGDTLFDYLLVTRALYLHAARWGKTFVPGLTALLEEYRSTVELRHIGFPKDWLERLRKE